MVTITSVKPEAQNYKKLESVRCIKCASVHAVYTDVKNSHEAICLRFMHREYTITYTSNVKNTNIFFKLQKEHTFHIN